AAGFDEDFFIAAGEEKPVVGGFLAMAGFEDFGDGAGNGLARFAMNAFENFADGFAFGFAVGPAGEFFGDLVHQNDAAIDIGGDDAVADGAERDVEAFFFGGYFFFGALAFGDVPKDALNADELVFGIVNGRF